MCAGMKLVSKSCALQAMHTNALGMVASDQFSENCVDGGVNKPGQRDGIIYGPCFGYTCFTSLMLVSNTSSLFEEWRGDRMTPNKGTSGEVFEHVSDMCASPSAIWRWTFSKKRRADMSKRYAEAPPLKVLMVGSGVLSALYSYIPAGLVTRGMTHRVLCMCSCAHVWISAWNTLCSSHLTGKKFENVLYRYPDMCLVIATEVGDILTSKASSRDIDRDVNVFYYLVEALSEWGKNAKVAATYHKAVAKTTFLSLAQWCFFATYLREGEDEQGKEANYSMSRVALELWVDFCSKVGRATTRAEVIWDMLQTPEIALNGQQSLAKALAVFSDITDAPPEELTWNAASDFRKGILQTFSDFYPGVYTAQQLRAAELNPPPAPPVRKPEDEVDEAVPPKQTGAGQGEGDGTVPRPEGGCWDFRGCSTREG